MQCSALLSEGARLRLREEFEDRTGEVRPLNVGQVHRTMQRLEHDGLAGSYGSGGEGPQKAFRITSDGERELAAWLRTPPDLSSPPRDELVMKAATALASASHEDDTMNETTGGRRRWCRTRATSPIEFRLDAASGVPAYLRRAQLVEHAPRLGYLQPGGQRPKVGDVVAAVAINPNAVQKAGKELEAKDLAVGRPASDGETKGVA